MNSCSLNLVIVHMLNVKKLLTLNRGFRKRVDWVGIVSGAIYYIRSFIAVLSLDYERPDLGDPLWAGSINIIYDFSSIGLLIVNCDPTYFGIKVLKSVGAAFPW